MNILAIDPGTQTGWALYFEGTLTSGTWDCSVRRDESGGMRLIRFRAKLNEIFALQRGGSLLDVMVYEAARHGASRMQGALVVQSELQGILKLYCQDGRIQYRGYSPSEIKKFATGKGNAPKKDVFGAAKITFPDQDVLDDNQADALMLLALARRDYDVNLRT